MLVVHSLVRRAVVLGAVCFAALAVVLVLSTDRASAAVDDFDDDVSQLADESGPSPSRDDEPATIDEEQGSWSRPTYESAGRWLGYARAFMPSSASRTPTSPASSPSAGANDPPAGARQHSGDASWYSTTPGACAHRTVPEGTSITVTNLKNGKSTSCTVEGWGPADTSRVIDLSEESFAAIADPDVGVVPVRYTW